jgi:RimJ/RimL family protein N-acetyltransferase
MQKLKTDIRPYDSKDCTELFKIATDKIFTWLPYGPFKNVQEMQNFYQKKSRNCEFFTVFDRKDKTIHGILAIKYIIPEHKKCEIGHIWYAEKYQRTHVNTQAMYLVLCKCFDERKYRRVAWKCDKLNTVSSKCALRLGFKHEGIFRNDQLVKGENKDTAWFSIINKEWPQVKDKLINLICKPY